MRAREVSHKFYSTVKKFQPSTYSKKAVVSTSDSRKPLFKPGHDFIDEPLKPDHRLRPLWIDRQNGRVVLESFSPSFKRAQNFLVNVAEPVVGRRTCMSTSLIHTVYLLRYQ